jgi:hypothetical protein
VTPLDCVDLEIGLARGGAGGYAVELRVSAPGSDVEVRVGAREGHAAALDLDRLAALALQPAAYGQALAAGLFAAPAVAEAYARADALARGSGVPLRLRLAIAGDAPELHGLRWELLHAPGGGAIADGERVLLSRYLASVDWEPVKLRSRDELRALVVVAAPSDLAAYGLAAIDVAGELARIEAALAGISVTRLAGPGQATLAAIVDRLRDGHDLLYLVAHGTTTRGEAVLWLEDADGRVTRASAAEFAARLAGLQQRPRLCVLESCRSAGPGRGGDAAAVSALGPSLARAGVAAVVAMQGDLSMATGAVLMPRLFAELLADGRVDRAVAVARAAVRDRPDWWMPVLFMRLRTGRIWYTPGFGGEGGRFEKWPALLQSIQQGRCTPVLGPALADPLLGPSRELARRWADAYGYPLSTGGREDLPQVAQYLAVHQDDAFPRAELPHALVEAVRARFPEAVPGDRSDDLGELLARASDWRTARGAFDPHAVLARLPCPLYITTAGDELLAHRLRARGREPAAAVCPWHEDLAADAGAAETATVARPLVYHLFGRLAEPESLVLTEDDIFDFLLGVAADRDLIPARVRAALVDSALLILGFSLEDWKFRVVFRSLMRQRGGRRRKRYAHVAAQIDPEEAQTIDPARARRYLEGYFEDADVTIFWGSAEDFLRELAGRLPAEAAT